MTSSDNAATPIIAAEPIPVEPVMYPLPPLPYADNLLVTLTEDLPIYQSPTNLNAIGSLPASSKYLHQPTTAWVIKTTDDGAFGEVVIPWNNNSQTGWINLNGLELSHTSTALIIKRSEHKLIILSHGEVLATLITGVGAAASPTPLGKFFVTERIDNPGGPYGAYAFGLSGFQPHPPAGWHGPAQMAIHGTNNPASIGTNMSAGCAHLAESSLKRLIPLVPLGTPVIIEN